MVITEMRTLWTLPAFQSGTHARDRLESQPEHDDGKLRICFLFISRSTSLPAAASTRLSLPAGLSAPWVTWQNVAPVAYGVSSSHLHRDDSFLWVPVPKSPGRFLIGLACIRCLPLDQSTAAREGLFARMVDSVVTM